MNKKVILMLSVCMLLMTTVNLPMHVNASESWTADKNIVTEKKEEADLYGIGSISKIITAAAVMKLCDMELLELDKPVQEYLPEFTMADNRYEQITVRMLLNHSSGLAGMTDNNAQLLGDNSTYAHDMLLEKLRTQRLKHEPGSRSIYCNDGYTLAEILIEKVSHMSYTEFLNTYFCKPLGLTDILTPESDFDRERLVPIRFGNLSVKEEALNLIGSGGIYASAEDLCLFSQIFMEDNRILSEESKKAMMEFEHIGAFMEEEADSIFGFGLGFDSVNTYPFGKLGLKALSKGGSTAFYHSNITILPEQNISAVVLSSGVSSYESIIAQKIILAVLEEEGIIPHTEMELPKYNGDGKPIEDKWYAYEGLYGGMNLLEVKLSGNELLVSTKGEKNDRTFRFLHTGNGEFISQDGYYISISVNMLTAAEGGNIGVTKLYFVESEDGETYLYADSYMETAGLGQSAISQPIAQKIETGIADSADLKKWKEREDRQYLLVNETFSSSQYLSSPVVKLQVDDNGYIRQGIYEERGFFISPVKIENSSKAVPFQATPVMAGRDANTVTASTEHGQKYLDIRGYRFISEANIGLAIEAANSIQIPENGETVWLKITPDMQEEQWKLTMPEDASYFVYNEDFRCLETSLEKEATDLITLPEQGYVAFAGKAGAVISVEKLN